MKHNGGKQQGKQNSVNGPNNADKGQGPNSRALDINLVELRRM